MRSYIVTDKNPRKRNRVNNSIKGVDVTEEIQNLTSDKNVEENKITKDNNEISINYVMTRKRWNRTNVVIDNVFAYNVALDIIYNLLKNVDRENIDLCEKNQLRQN